jgi:hypothetical protein
VFSGHTDDRVPDPQSRPPWWDCLGPDPDIESARRRAWRVGARARFHRWGSSGNAMTTDTRVAHASGADREADRSPCRVAAAQCAAAACYMPDRKVGLVEYLQRPDRTVILEFPVQMADGNVRNVVGFRVLHNRARVPAPAESGFIPTSLQRRCVLWLRGWRGSVPSSISRSAARPAASSVIRNCSAEKSSGRSHGGSLPSSATPSGPTQGCQDRMSGPGRRPWRGCMTLIR